MFLYIRWYRILNWYDEIYYDGRKYRIFRMWILLDFYFLVLFESIYGFGLRFII